MPKDDLNCPLTILTCWFQKVGVKESLFLLLLLLLLDNLCSMHTRTPTTRRRRRAFVLHQLSQLEATSY